MKHAVLITGASSGIGHASARLFARKGYDLILVGRNQDALKELEEELSFINVEVMSVVKDLSKKHAVEELYEMLKEYPIEILMNNAGFGDYGKFLESDYRKNRDMIRVNILALTEMTYRFGKLMVKRGKGKILNVASIAGLCPGPYMNVYYATKAYVLSFSEAMAEELKGTGVTCTCLCPGPTQTNFWQRANVTASPIMKFFKPDTAEHVAYKGVEGLMKKRVVVFNNISGQLLNLAVRVMPRAVIRKKCRLYEWEKMMKEERVVHPLAPIVDEECEILILGSLPSVKSREEHFYYANKQNRFWKVISAIYHEELPTNKTKEEVLLKHHIALWDSIHSCIIKGSSDASIKDVIPNDIPQLINHTHIHTIICNGKTSEKYYKKYLEDKTHITPITLPSTSSANASYSLKKLIELYTNALKQA